MLKSSNTSAHEQPPGSRFSAKLRKRLLSARGLIIVSFLAIFSVVLFLAIPRIKEAYHLKQGHKLLLEGEAFAKNKQWEKASAAFSQAIQHGPSDPKIVRGVASFLKNIDPERSLFFWRQLVSTGVATAEDHVQMAGTLLITGKPSAARQVFAALPDSVKETKESLEVEAGLLLAEGRQMEAEQKMRKALQLDPDNPESQFKLAAMDLRSPLSEIQSEAVNTLWRLVERGSDVSDAAMNILATDARVNREQFDKLLTLANAKDSKSNFSDKRTYYSMLRRKLERYPLERDDVLKKEHDRLNQTSVDDKIHYFIMLKDLGLHKQLLEQLPKDHIRSNRELFSLYTDSMVASEQWSALRDFIKNSQALPSSGIELAVLLARASKALNDNDKVIRGYLSEASRLAVASRDNRVIQRVSQITTSMGFPEVAIESLRTGVTIPQQRIALLEMILKVQAEDKQTESMLNTLEELVIADPKLYTYWQRVLYLRLLLGLKMETVPYEQAQLTQQPGTDPTTLNLISALMAFRSGDRQALTDTLEKMSDTTQFDAGQRAVYSGLLSLSGQPAKAYKIAEKVPQSLLLQEEKLFLLQAL